ncbi:MAG: DUF3987 domain-containing protein [Desulfovibrio sp.]|jgi:hypothetical protein|nr:DUF3987 domain-containing protein [Desulfovibrio sp.]
MGDHTIKPDDFASCFDFFDEDNAPGSPEDGEETEAVTSPFLDAAPLPPLADIFPAAVVDALGELGEIFACGTVPALAGLEMFVSTCVGNARRIWVTNTWTEPLVTWTVLVGDSGIGKSPILRWLFKPINAAESKSLREFNEACERYEVELREYLADRKAAKSKDEGNLVGIVPPPQPPRRKSLYYSGGTIDGLLQLVADNPRGIMYRSDELASTIKAFDKYSGCKGETPATLMSLHDGDSINLVFKDRKKSVYIAEGYCGIFGTVQPAIFKDMFDKSWIDSGFLPRCTLLRVEKDAPDEWTDRTLGQETASLFTDMADFFLSWDLRQDNLGASLPEIVRMDTEAKALFVTWYNDVCKRCFVSARPVVYRKILGKALRLTLLVHCVDCAINRDDASRTIDADCMRRGLRLAEYHLSQELELYRLLDEDAAKQVHPLERALMRECVKHAGDIERMGWTIPNKTLHEWVSTRLRMATLARDRLGKTCSALGMRRVKIRGGRGWMVTRELLDVFRKSA